MHFTYKPDVDKTTLMQGDVLEKTDKLHKLLTKYHRHYANPEYTHFQVLTQSCDLVRRNGKDCSARYITIAAVRSFDTVVERAVTSQTKTRVILDGTVFCSDSNKGGLASYISTLLNNNAKEFFYLHAFPENKLLNDSCTFLHLSVAIRADEHYDLCLEAKTIELEENFRAKLGWMVGNIYSRVGTADFSPTFLQPKAFKKYIEDILKKHVAWVKSSAFNEFKKNAEENSDLSFDEIYDKAQQNLEKKKQDRINSFVLQLKTSSGLTAEQEEKIKVFLSTERGGRYLS